MKEKTSFLQFACRLSNDDVDILAKQNSLDGLQKNVLRTMMAFVVQKIKIHVYYKKTETNQILGVMTLGEKCDDWCEAFLEEEEIWKGYMADQIAMRALQNGYEVFRKVLENQFLCAVSPLHFYEQTGSQLEQVFGELEQGEVKLLSSGQMAPLKSVLFTIDILSQKDDEQVAQDVEKGLCSACGNVNCPNRITDK